MTTKSGAADHVGRLLHDEHDDEALARELIADVTSIVRSVLGPRDPHLLQTAAHDALLAVIRYRDGFRGDARGSTWLYTVVRHEALRVARRESRRGAVEICVGEEGEHLLHEARATAATPDATLIGWELLRELVPNRDWRKLWLLYNDPDQRMSHEELARASGRTVGSVAVTLSRVRGRLAMLGEVA